MALVAPSSSGAAAVKAKSPAQLRSALLASNYTQLPAGFTDPKVSYENPSRDGQVGVAVIDLSGPHYSDAAIRFSIYRTRGYALKALHDAEWGRDLEVVGRAPGWGRQSVMITGSVTGKNILGATVTNGVTVLAVVRRNVIVQSVTASVSSKDSGDVLAARRLLAYAVRRLDRLR